jgi:NAD(P)-dependent dehydrogenase (short-subunit alcohol dehydrogenase family)
VVIANRSAVGGEETVRLITTAGGEAAFIQTDPSGRIGEPEDVAEAVVWLCSDAASFVVGHTLVVDGGVLAQ